MNPFRRLIPPFLLVLVIVLFGTIGYTTVERWSLLDSFYMLVITLFTVGYGEVHPLSIFGKVLTMVIIVSGVGAAIYTIGVIGEIIVEGHIFGYRRRKRMENMIMEMKNHYIICGFGRVGQQVAEELTAAAIPFVVIDTKKETTDDLEAKGVPCILGDVTLDKNLQAAGIMTAKGLIATADSDTANVFVTLSARVLNPKLYIISRAGYSDSAEKLKKAGANKVISPYLIAGKHIAELAVKHKE